MAVLTWRNVDSPNFNGSIDGLATAGRLIGNSTTGLADALGKFGDYQTQQADTAALLNAQKYQDAAGLRAGLQSGAVFNGVDQSHVNAATIKNLNGQVNDLLTQQTTQQNLDKGVLDMDQTRLNVQKGQYGFDRLQKGDAAGDAFAPIQANALALAASGKHDQANALLNDPKFAALPYEKQQEVISKLQSAEGTNTTNSQSAFTLNRDQTAYKDQQAGLQAAMDAMQDGTPDGARRSLMGRSDLSPAALEYAQRFIGGHGYGDMNAPIGTPVTGVAGGGAGSSATPVVGGGNGAAGTLGGNSYSVVLGGGRYGLPTDDKGQPVDITTKTMGEVNDFGTKLIDKTRNDPQLGLADTGKGSSAMGAYQFTNESRETYGKKLFGDNWKNQKYDADTQEKLAEAMYNDSKGGDLSKIWTSLKKIPGAEKTGAFANMPWSQAKQIIAGGESNTNALRNSRLATANTVQQLIDSASMRNTQNLAPTIDPDTWTKAYSANDSLDKVTNDLITTVPSLKGANSSYVSNFVQKLVDDSKHGGQVPQMSYKQAGLIAQNSLRGTDSSWLGNWTRSSGILTSASQAPSSMAFNDAAAQDLSERYQTGQFMSDAQGKRLADQNVEGLKTALAQSQAADNALQQAQLASTRGLRNVSYATLSDLAAQAELAHQNLDALQSQVQAKDAQGNRPNLAKGTDVATKIVEDVKKAAAAKKAATNNLPNARKQNPLSIG
jgi:hypothetical protein